MSPFVAALAAGALFVVLAVPAAVGKEGVRARLDTPVALEATPGRTIKIAWSLSYTEFGERRPFGASGVFVRLLSASHGQPVTAYGKARETGPYRAGAALPGEYVAKVRVPEGGIGAIKIGLDGWRITGGHKEEADAFFPIDNDPFATAAVAARNARTPAPTAGAGRPPIWLAGAGALAALGAILAVRRGFASRRPRGGDLA